MSTLRRIPMDSNFMKGNINISRSKPNDVLYGYLQLVSTYCKTTQRRFIYASTYSHVKAEQYFGNGENGKPKFPRKNIERAFKVLLDYGFTLNMVSWSNNVRFSLKTANSYPRIIEIIREIENTTDLNII